MNFSDFCMTGDDLDLRSLKWETKESVRAAHATGTRKNLKTQWRSFFLFCFYYELVPLPCELETICLFAQFLSRSFKSVDSIRNYLYGVKFLHLFLDIPFTHFETFYFRLFLRGLKRTNPHCVKSALPITPTILFKFKEVLDFSVNNNCTYWCLFLFAFFLMCRISNLLGTQDDSSKCLKRENIRVFRNYLLIKFSWSKTIQFGERELEIPIMRNTNSPLCAYTAFIEMSKAFPVSSDSPAFVVNIGKNNRPVSYVMLQGFLKVIISKIGYDPSSYSSHSFRRGGATWAFQSGVPSELIQFLGDWRSDVYKEYLKYNIKDKLHVSSIMNEFL